MFEPSFVMVGFLAFDVPAVVASRVFSRAKTDDMANEHVLQDSLKVKFQP